MYNRLYSGPRGKRETSPRAGAAPKRKLRSLLAERNFPARGGGARRSPQQDQHFQDEQRGGDGAGVDKAIGQKLDDAEKCPQKERQVHVVRLRRRGRLAGMAVPADVCAAVPAVVPVIAPADVRAAALAGIKDRSCRRG